MLNVYYILYSKIKKARILTFSFNFSNFLLISPNTLKGLISRYVNGNTRSIQALETSFVTHT